MGIHLVHARCIPEGIYACCLDIHPVCDHPQYSSETRYKQRTYTCHFTPITTVSVVFRLLDAKWPISDRT